MLAELIIFAAISLFIYAFYKWATINNDFFKKRNIRYLKPKFFVGSTGGLFLSRYTAPEFSKKLYNSFPDEPIYGLFDFRVPQFVVRSPETFKQIAIKDFDHFEDHRKFADPSTDTLFGNSLVFMKGEKWRNMRSTLSPAFTSSKMKQMFELIVECADDVVEHFTAKAKIGEKINIEMKDFFSRYTTDVIGSCAFGLKINSFIDPENEFFVNGRKIMSFSLKQVLKLVLMLRLPAVARAFNITLLGTTIARSFRNTILNTMQFREQNNIQRFDMINIMMQIRKGTLKQTDEKNDKEKEGFATVEESDVGKMAVKGNWTDDEIVSQCLTFFIGGFDTSSTLLSFVAYELAINPDIQQRLYEEIVATNEELGGGKRITYDALQKMKYLDQVICETLRKWPPGIQLDRLCVKDYNFDDGDKLKFKIEKGTIILFPVYGLHHDPQYFPEPDKFDPERFSDENKDRIQSVFVPFGVGPRGCIGSRFALVQIKAVLYNLLLRFTFEPNAQTQIPLKMKKSPFAVVSEKGIHLEMKLRKT